MPDCNEKGCPLLTSGKCQEGFSDPVECPHYISDVILDEESIVEKDENGKEESTSISVYSGRAIPLSEVNRISLCNITRLIIFAGMPDSGKTTLLLSLIHIFQTNPSFAGFLFAGSQTLVDFEEKSFKSKVQSMQHESDTDRTILHEEDPIRFLHLTLASVANLRKRQELIFTDVSGELFKNLRHSTKACKEFYICKRADHFVLFMDADGLSDYNKRALTKSNAIGVLQSLVEAESLTPITNVQIVFSRWDLLEEKTDRETHLKYIDGISNEIIAKYGDRFNVGFYKVASRPKPATQILFGLGIEELLPIWVNKSYIETLPGEDGSNMLPMTISTRQFLQY